MKKLVLATGLVAAMATTAVAGEQKIENDPFASTQGIGLGMGLAIAGGLALVIAVVAADDSE